MMKTRHMTRRRGLEDGRDRALSTATTSTANSDPTSNRADSIDFGIDLSSSDGGGKSLSHLVKAHDDGGMGSSSHNFHISDRSSSIDYFMDSQMEATKKKPLDSPVAAGTRNAARRRAASTTPAPAIVPAVTATVSNPLSIPNAVAKAPSQAIPRGFPLHQQSHNSQQVQEQQHSSSHDSSGDAFLNGIMNNAAHISHTPPTALGTSYENDHFGKRQRSGVRFINVWLFTVYRSVPCTGIFIVSASYTIAPVCIVCSKEISYIVPFFQKKILYYRAFLVA